MNTEPPDSPYFRKLLAFERCLGLCGVPDRTLLKIARHKCPGLPPDRWAAILVIYVNKLPIPVSPRDSDERAR